MDQKNRMALLVTPEFRILSFSSSNHVIELYNQYYEMEKYRERFPFYEKAHDKIRKLKEGKYASDVTEAVTSVNSAFITNQIETISDYIFSIVNIIETFERKDD